MRLRLNGWQRLWALIGVLYGVLVVGVCYFNFPRFESVTHQGGFYNQFSIEQRSLLAGNGEFVKEQTETGQQVEFPNGHVMTFKPGVTEEQIGTVARAYAQAVQTVLSSHRVNFTLHAVLAWLVPSLGLYAIGWGIAWVRRGFREQLKP
jgi:hypothetical protein